MSRPKHGTLARAAQHHDEADRICIDCAEVERDYAFEQWKYEREIATERLHDRDRARTIAVHLEQENAELRAVLAQVGLLQEHYAHHPDHWEVAGEIGHVLGGATFEEVRDG